MTVSLVNSDVIIPPCFLSVKRIYSIATSARKLYTFYKTAGFEESSAQFTWDGVGYLYCAGTVVNIPLCLKTAE